MWPWETGLTNLDTGQWQFCMSFCNSTLSQWAAFSFGNLSQHGIALQTTCTSPTGCRRDGNNFGAGYLSGVVVTLADDVAPATRITGGSLTTAGWKRGTQTIDYSATDNTGIRTLETIADGVVVGRQDFACDPHRPVPCANAGGGLPLDTRRVFSGDGRHTLTIRATDGGENTSSASQTVLVDNTAPAQPQNLTLMGSGDWQSTNQFEATWQPPTSAGAPIAAARYELCPVSGPSSACRDATQSGSGTRLENLQVPGDGEWRLRVWLQDAAGNADPNRSALTGPLRLDRMAPSVTMTPPAADDPTRVHVAASDATSGVASLAVEVHRDGSDTWIPVPVSGPPGDASAVIDDQHFPAGTYEVRARAVDAAGNERTATSWNGRNPAALRLPARIVTRLVMTTSGPKYSRGETARHVRIRLGRRVPLHGRMTMPGGNPVSAADVAVAQRVDLPGTRWRPVALVRTSRSGWFAFRAPRGPNRILRFSYDGTPTLRGVRRFVRIGVRAATTIVPTPRHVVNGAYVRFHGRLRGGWLPAGGKLVELQVFTRREWRTFAEPRASARTGRWSFNYRFETIVGRVSFRFRAVIPHEAAYPYDSGTSRPTRVEVRGL
jgi:hypothetical protein